MKEFLRSLFNKSGFDLVRTKHFHGDYASHLKNVINDKHVECVVDVGANAGQFGEFLRENGYNGHIVSFEPVQSVYASLEEKCGKDERWSCHQLALGSESDRKNINVYESTVFSSFLEANDYSKNIWHSLENVAAEEVQVCRLDEVYEDLVGSLGCSSHMLKLDTQGYDRQVFDGSHGCLDKFCVLQSELSFIPVYDGMPDAYEVLEEYHKQGFFISGIYPINRDASLALIESDCVLVKRTTA